MKKFKVCSNSINIAIISNNIIYTLSRSFINPNVLTIVKYEGSG